MTSLSRYTLIYSASLPPLRHNCTPPPPPPQLPQRSLAGRNLRSKRSISTTSLLNIFSLLRGCESAKLVFVRPQVLYVISGAMLVSPPPALPPHPTPPPPSPSNAFARQLCDFSALKQQQQQSSKQKHEASFNSQASTQASASPFPGSSSPTRLRPRSQHGSGKAVSNGHTGTSPSTKNTSPIARNAESSSPLRLSSPNSPPLTHKNYKVRRAASRRCHQNLSLSTKQNFRFMLAGAPE